jgi:hypothetical protein
MEVRPERDFRDVKDTAWGWAFASMQRANARKNPMPPRVFMRLL